MRTNTRGLPTWHVIPYTVVCSSAKSSILTGPPEEKNAHVGRALCSKVLKSPGKASPPKGFIAGDPTPEDSTRAHLIASPAIQHTLYVYGVYKYCHSPLAPEGQKQEIREIRHDI